MAHDALSLLCDQCGAPLDIPNDAQFVTCRHCGTHLSVERTDSAAFTREIDSLRERDEELESRIARLEAFAPKRPKEVVPKDPMEALAYSVKRRGRKLNSRLLKDFRNEAEEARVGCLVTAAFVFVIVLVATLGR